MAWVKGCSRCWELLSDDYINDDGTSVCCGAEVVDFHICDDCKEFCPESELLDVGIERAGLEYVCRNCAREYINAPTLIEYCRDNGELDIFADYVKNNRAQAIANLNMFCRDYIEEDDDYIQNYVKFCRKHSYY